MPRIAKSLAVLRDQINAAYPRRRKTSDGWIGDPAHAARASDHNPNSSGVVTALDITHDPANGVDTWKLAEILRQVRDPRIKYVISNGRIFSSKTSPWVWRPYTGPNKHAHHIHISVVASLADMESAWAIHLAPRTSTPTPRPEPIAPPKGITADMRRRMAKKIVDFEARRDRQGRLQVYNLPANDGGGAFEVAGINVRYHPAQAQRLRSLILAGDYDEAEASVINYLLQYTNAATGWTTDAGVEFYLRDCVFNRGPKGAARILQRALGVTDDGEIGPTTRGAMSRVSAKDLLTKLRAARENYERAVVGYRANSWNGLVNRWDKALVAAQAFQKEQGALPAVVRDSIKVGVPAAGSGWLLWDWIAAHPVISTVIAMILIAVGLFAWAALKEWWDKPPAHPIAPAGSTDEGNET